MTKTIQPIPTPKTDAAIEALDSALEDAAKALDSAKRAIGAAKRASTRVKSAIATDIRAAVKTLTIANGKAAAAAQETPQGSPERQRVITVDKTVQEAEAVAEHPENYTEKQLSEIAAMLKGLVAMVGDAPKQPEPASPKDIAKALAEELAPRLAPPAPAPAPVPEPVDVAAVAKAAANQAVEQFAPLLAKDANGQPTQAASLEAHNALEGHVNNLQGQVNQIRNNAGTQPNWWLGGICGLITLIVLGLILWFTAGWMLALAISVLAAAAVTGLVAFIFEHDIHPNPNN